MSQATQRSSGRQFIRSRSLPCLCALAGLLLAASPVRAAEEGQFTVERFSLKVFVNPDASVGLNYDFTLRLHEHAATLDELFFPLPHERFDLKGIRATLSDKPLTLHQERYERAGFWLRLGKQKLSRTDRGRFHLELTIRDMVAADPRRADHAMFEFEPPRLAGMSPTGVGDVAIAVHALPDIKPDELHASGGKNVRSGEFDGRATLAWRWPQGRLAKIGALRASFPQRGLHRLAARSALGGPVRWLERTLWARIALGVVFLLAFWFFYFRFTNGRGLAAFLVLAGVLAALMALSAAAQLVLLPCLALLVGAGELYRYRTRAAAQEEAEVDEDIQVEVFPQEDGAV